ncbi:DUF4097 family beta strand repeat-containing protein [Streptomyces sp. NPDC048623]|uniref:DUF4097 family beta strand repeat-containing protein n=1 Tax=Streptomyces sp. NPDC048623 TaxID=3155761 RepID=UPI00342C79E8
MPTYETPEPITAILEFDIAHVRLAAGKRMNTVVEVEPSNPDDENDNRAAQQTKVTYANGTLTLKGPRKRSVFGRVGSVDITIELPAGSQLQAHSSMGDFHCQGPLGESRVRSGLGDILLDETGPAVLRTDHGDVRVDRATGDADINGQGRIDLGEIAGALTLKNGIGDTTIGTVTGELRAKVSMGRVTVGAAESSVDIRTSQGSIQVNEVARGKVELRTSLGSVEVGVRESTAAWLDVTAKVGVVRNSLGAAEGPGDAAETVEVHASTGAGDIVIRRA